MAFLLPAKFNDVFGMDRLLGDCIEYILVLASFYSRLYLRAFVLRFFVLYMIYDCVGYAL
jgi:hypothetical protein